jgi:tetratricopeptide (TPR) repeat protein
VRLKVLLFLALLPPLLSSRAIADDWFVYTTDHFRVYSDAREDRVVDVLEDLENFRRVMFLILGLHDGADDERFRIVIFSRNLDYNRMTNFSGTRAGYYNPIILPTLLLGPRFGRSEYRSTLFRRYFYTVMDRYFAINYPAWYAEGLGQLFGTVEISDSAAIVGIPPDNLQDRYGILQLTDDHLSDVLGPDPVLNTTFRRASWLMVHYLLIDAQADSDRVTRTADYLRRFDAGEDPLEAFEESFGTSVQDFERAINDYSESREFTTLELGGIEYSGQRSRRMLAPKEYLYLLADLAVERSNIDAAHAYLDDSREFESPAELTMKARGRRLIAFIHDNEVERGDALAEALIAENPADPDVLADIAHYFHDRFGQILRETNERQDIFLDRSIDYGVRAIEQSPTDLEAIYYLGKAYEYRGDLQLAADTLLMFYDLDPSIPELNLLLARVLAKGGQKELASYLISRTISASVSSLGREYLRDVQRQIETEDPDAATLDELLPI